LRGRKDRKRDGGASQQAMEHDASSGVTDFSGATLRKPRKGRQSLK
jgi:hypothetical protein